MWSHISSLIAVIKRSQRSQRSDFDFKELLPVCIETLEINTPIQHKTAPDIHLLPSHIFWIRLCGRQEWDCRNQFKSVELWIRIHIAVGQRIMQLSYQSSPLETQIMQFYSQICMPLNVLHLQDLFSTRTISREKGREKRKWFQGRWGLWISTVCVCAHVHIIS